VYIVLVMLSQVSLGSLGLVDSRVQLDSLEVLDRLEWLVHVDNRVRRAHPDNLETVDNLVRPAQQARREFRDLVVSKAVVELLERMDSLEELETLDKLDFQDLPVNQVTDHNYHVIYVCDTLNKTSLVLIFCFFASLLVVVVNSSSFISL